MEVARERVRGGRPLPGARAVQPRRELRVAPHQAPAARAHRRREVRLQRALRPARLAGGRGLRPGAAPAHRPCSVACTCTCTCVAQVCVCACVLQLVGGCYEESAAAASLRRSWLVAGGTMCRNEARACLLSYTVPPTACAAMPSLLPARCGKLQRRERSIACRTIDFWWHLDRAVSQAKPRRLSCRA